MGFLRLKNLGCFFKVVTTPYFHCVAKCTFLNFFYLDLKNTDFIMIICIKQNFTGFHQPSKRKYCDPFKISFSNKNTPL